MAKPKLTSYPAPKRVSRGSVSKPSDPTQNAGWGSPRPQLPSTGRLNRGSVSHPKN